MRTLALLFSFIWVSTTYAGPSETPAPQPSETPAPQPSITTLKAAPERQVPSGKARIKTLAQGEKAFVGQLWLAPGASVPQHRDASEEYIYVVSGSGELTINGQTSKIGPGTMVFMPAGAEVSYKNGSAPLVALQIFAGPESAAKYAGWPAREPTQAAP